MARDAVSSLKKISRECKSFPRKLVEDSAKTITKGIKASLAKDTGGDSSLSGAPAKLKTRTTIKGDSTVIATIVPNPKRNMGIWSWLEKGTNPHKIRGSQRIHSPAKHTWSRSTEPELKRLANKAQVEFIKIIRG